MLLAYMAAGAVAPLVMGYGYGWLLDNTAWTGHYEPVIGPSGGDLARGAGIFLSAAFAGLMFVGFVNTEQCDEKEPDTTGDAGWDNN